MKVYQTSQEDLYSEKNIYLMDTVFLTGVILDKTNEYEFFINAVTCYTEREVQSQPFSWNVVLGRGLQDL